MASRSKASAGIDLQALGLRARNRRIALGLTQQDIAKRTNGQLLQSAVSRIEHGSQVPGRAAPGDIYAGTIIALARALGTTPDGLLLEIEPTPSLRAFLDSDVGRTITELERHELIMAQGWAGPLSPIMWGLVLEIIRVRLGNVRGQRRNKSSKQ